MPIDPILANPTLPIVYDARGPLLYDKTIGQNDVDVDDKDEAGVDTPDSDE